MHDDVYVRLVRGHDQHRCADKLKLANWRPTAAMECVQCQNNAARIPFDRTIQKEVPKQVIGADMELSAEIESAGLVGRFNEAAMVPTRVPL